MMALLTFAACLWFLLGAIGSMCMSLGDFFLGKQVTKWGGLDHLVGTIFGLFCFLLGYRHLIDSYKIYTDRNKKK
tara:strand:- start:292 stop:516 length:225 start_codon:yes stop_codon:yes gene_type:complete